MADDIKSLQLDDKPEPLEERSKKRGKKTRKKKKIKKKRARKLSLSPQFLKTSVRVLIVMLVILLEVGVSYTVVTRFFMSDDGAEDAETVSEVRAEEDQGVEVEDEPEPPQQTPLSSDGSQIDYGRLQGVVTLDDIVVNPAFSGGKRYFVTSIVLAVDMRPRLTHSIPIRSTSSGMVAASTWTVAPLMPTPLGSARPPGSCGSPLPMIRSL